MPAETTPFAFDIELVTPLVIGGAEAKDSDPLVEGLRPPAIRGWMRWWFRALTAGTVPQPGDDSDILADRVLKLERQVFGGVGKDTGSASANASTITVRSLPFPTGRGGAAPAVAHLRMGDEGGGARRRAIDSSGRSSLFISCKNPHFSNAALWSFWLAVMLGGFGARSRRGFGSIRVTSAPTVPEGMQFIYADPDPKILAAFTGKHLTAGRSAFAELASVGDLSKVPRPPGDAFRRPGRLEILSPDRNDSRIWIVAPKSGPWTDWSKAMEGLRQDFYRGYKRVVGFREREGIGSAEQNDRDPSPLIIQIKRAGDSYFGVIAAIRDSDDTANPRYYKPFQGKIGLDGIDAFLAQSQLQAEEVNWS